MSDEKNFVFENYKSIAHLLNVINNRKNNEVMKNCHSSEKETDSDWSGTSSYEEAEKLLSFGWGDILQDVKSNIEENKKLYYNLLDAKKMKIKNEVVGFIPNVPNAIQNLPKSMINIKHDIKKVKTVSVFYLNDGNCMVGRDEFIKAGSLLLAAIQLLENNSIRIELNLCFNAAVAGNEICLGNIKLKELRQPLNLKKICFPMAHPSMLRRIGFKFIETTPNLTESGFASGYGRTPDKSEEEEIALFIKEKFQNSNTILLSRRMIKEDFKYNMEMLLDSFKINK